MSRRVLKFVLRPDITAIETGDEPTCLAVGWQGPNLCVWVAAEVARERHPNIVTKFAVIPTGADVPGDAIYVGSSQTGASGDWLVMHVYRHLGGAAS